MPSLKRFFIILLAILQAWMLYDLTLRLTAINLTNKDALYNFPSTSSGAHFVTPRAFSAQVGLVF